MNDELYDLVDIYKLAIAREAPYLYPKKVVKDYSNQGHSGARSLCPAPIRKEPYITLHYRKCLVYCSTTKVMILPESSVLGAGRAEEDLFIEHADPKSFEKVLELVRFYHRQF